MDTAIKERIKNFFSPYKTQFYKKGEILVRADDPPSGVFYLKAGTVKMYAISRKGDELIINVFKPFSFFPMSWAVNNTPNNYYFEAMTAVEVIKAPREKVVEFVKSDPVVMYDLLCRVFRGTDGLLARMSYLMAGNAYLRLIAEILIQAKRFGKTEGKHVEFKVSEKDLAAFSGLTRETVSREMKLLKDKELVAFDTGGIIIKNIELLENELEGGV
ncbi:MAG: Crp/Fnr family transcriptional regulator [Candidatus Levybacteria bacterium]|nr:Crp/Fnr family transcriptional regulator [Candidatus Levybacteria bacterium]